MSEKKPATPQRRIVEALLKQIAADADQTQETPKIWSVTVKKDCSITLYFADGYRTVGNCIYYREDGILRPNDNRSSTNFHCVDEAYDIRVNGISNLLI